MTRATSFAGVGSLKFVNTSMHGVSNRFMQRAFEVFEYPPFVAVKEQELPDPEFPTVKFPNPEEKGKSNSVTRMAITHRRAGALVGALWNSHGQTPNLFH